MKRTNGHIENLNKTVLGKYTTKNNIFKRNKILFCKKLPLLSFGIKALIIPNNMNVKTNIPVLYVEEGIPFIENDLISINKDGEASVVWETNSPHNALYVTDVCNSKCIMCPQIDDNKSRYDDCLEIIKLLNLKNTNSIGITGGEPTIEINKLVKVLKRLAKKKTNINVHILTNGRNFANIENVRKLAEIKNINISFGIPLYSDIAEEHDFIVGVKGAFVQTISGLYNLAKFHQKIEIRTVILKQNHNKLKDLARYIYRNLPFVSHIALMCMEYHGNAETNYDLVSIDPINYKQELYETVRDFVRYNMIVDVYNLPLCLVDERIKEFCRDSISTWKKYYLSQCENCKEKDTCSGLFETSFRQSENIKPIQIKL